MVSFAYQNGVPHKFKHRQRGGPGPQGYIESRTSYSGPWFVNIGEHTLYERSVLKRIDMRGFMLFIDTSIRASSHQHVISSSETASVCRTLIRAKLAHKC